MSKQEKKMAGAMRLFEALSGVDEELLVRSEETAKVRPIWYYGRVLAACLCFVVMGALLWRVNPMLKSSMDSAGSMAPAAVEQAPAMAMEEAACEKATAVETANQESAKVEAPQEVTNNPQQSAVQDLQDSKESVSEAVGEATPLSKSKELALEDARGVAVLGEYVPDVIPAGYVFDSAWMTEKNTADAVEKISLCWVNGMDDIRISISFATADVTTVDVSRTETYDVHQYEIPYASTVPQEYRSVFNNPVFTAKDFSQEIVEKRMKVVADAGDTDTPRGYFAVLYEDGILVEFNGDGDAESIYEMMESVR